MPCWPMICAIRVLERSIAGELDISFAV
jgi:hypothetical protein